MCLCNFSPMCLFNFSHLGLADPLQRQLLLLTSSPPRGDKLWGRGGAFSFLSLFFLRMLCVWGFGWYWVLGVGPTGYTDSRAPGTRTERESWDAAPGFLFRDTQGGNSSRRKCWEILWIFERRWKEVNDNFWFLIIWILTLCKHKFVRSSYI